MEKGFTLIELLVSISIFVLITTIAVVNNSRFNSSVLLTNLAYEIGLSIRQAQVYGTTVKQSSADYTNFNSGYGIHFDLSSGGDSKAYTLFEDREPFDHVYNQIGDTDIETFHIQKGNYISGIYTYNNGDSTEQTKVDISFIRPNPDASIVSENVYYSKAEICVKSAQGTARKITVESTGQISVVGDNVIICSQ